MGYIYILDYSDCNICEIECDEKDEELDDLEESLKRRNLKLDNCAYMYSEEKIEDIIHLRP